MKVIITGGTGLIGSALARSLVRDGHDVVVLTRDPSRKVRSLPTSTRMVRWDGRTAEGWGSEVEGATAIVNLAGETIGPEGGLWTEDRKERILKSRLDATGAVVEAVRQASNRPSVLVQASGVDYYGANDDDEIVTEASRNGSGFLADVTRQWEAASAPVEALGVRRVIARTGIVLAKEGGTLRILALPYRMFVGGTLGGGKQYLSWIHMEDQVGAIRFLIENDAVEGVFNLTAPNPVTQKQLGETIAKVLRRPSVFPTPGFMLRAVLGEMSALVLSGQRAVPRALQEAGYDFRFPNIEGALRDLLA